MSLLKDLKNLRKAEARQITGAVYHYFIASREMLNEPFENGMTYQEYFAQKADDEMHHYLAELRMTGRLDSVRRHIAHRKGDPADINGMLSKLFSML